MYVGFLVYVGVDCRLSRKDKIFQELVAKHKTLQVSLGHDGLPFPTNQIILDFGALEVGLLINVEAGYLPSRKQLICLESGAKHVTLQVSLGHDGLSFPENQIFLDFGASDVGLLEMLRLIVFLIERNYREEEKIKRRGGNWGVRRNLMKRWR